jgi:hypothetical protein
VFDATFNNISVIGAIKNGQSRETGNIGTPDEEKTIPQHNMCWTPLYANKHK